MRSVKAAEPVLPPIPVSVADAQRHSSARMCTLRRIRALTAYRRARTSIRWAVSVLVSGEIAGACYLAATHRLSAWLIAVGATCFVSVSLAAADFAIVLVDMADLRLGELTGAESDGDGAEKHRAPTFMIVIDRG